MNRLDDYVDADETEAIKVQFSIPAGMNEAESADFNRRVKDFLVALSAMHAAMGGTGLQVVNEEGTFLPD
jgi:hypothetical protein